MVIDSIRDIDQQMNEMSADDYKKIKDNAEDVSRKLASGYFTKVALEAAHDYFAK